MPLTTKGSDKEGIYERTSMPITTITMYKYLIMLLNSSLCILIIKDSIIENTPNIKEQYHSCKILNITFMMSFPYDKGVKEVRSGICRRDSASLP